MAIAFNTTLRNNRLDEITALADAGSGAALIRIYSGTRPATGGTVTTLLAELVMTDPSFAAGSGGVLTAASVSDDLTPASAGTATWFRVVDSDFNFIMDGNVGTSGSDLNLNTTTISTGVPVSVTSFILTDGNA